MDRWKTALCLLLLANVAVAQPDQWTPTPNRQTESESTSDYNVAPIGSTPPNLGQLSQEHGQIWREYDIRSFTRRLRDQTKPEQVIVDWILRETGTAAWFGDPLSMLSVNRDVVRVYHTPDVQDAIKGIVDRFLSTRSEAHEVAVRLVTIENPDWRVKAKSMLTPVKTQTQGIEAWLISRENAALLLHELAKRSDYREHNSPNLTIYSGQSHTIKSTRPRTFMTATSDPRNATGLANMGQVDEGFSLQISPLVGGDKQTIEAVIQCSADQVERLTQVRVHEVDQYGMLKQSQIQIPQISSWQLHERFRWPVNEVLLVSRGVVATPGPTSPRNSLRRLINGGAPRADALLFLESRSEIRSAQRSPTMASRTDAANYRGRY